MMEHLVITYHMTKQGETAESCIDLPMLPEIAAAMLAGESNAAVDAILLQLAELQGYDSAAYCCCDKPKCRL